MTSKISKHPTFNHAQDITDICRPLKKLDISYFAHVHIDKDQNFSGICNNPGFLEQYLQNGYYNADIHMAKEKRLGNIVLWDALELDGMTKKMDCDAGSFGIKHTFTIIEKNHKGDNFYHFANNSSNKEINQVYLANLDLLKLFIEYFNENMTQSKILYSAYDLKFQVDSDHGGYATKTEYDNAMSIENRIKFIRDINSKENTQLTIPSEALSSRELDCMRYIVNGKSARETAEILGLSKRTVEFYLANIKAKLQVTSKSKLVDKFIKLYN